MYFQTIRPSLHFLNYCATICEAVLKVGKRSLCSSYSLHSGRRGSLPVCSNPPSSSPQMQTSSGLSSPGSTPQSSGGPSAVLTQLLQTLISHCLGLQRSFLSFCQNALMGCFWLCQVSWPCWPHLSLPQNALYQPCVDSVSLIPFLTVPKFSPKYYLLWSNFSSATNCQQYPHIPGLLFFHASTPTAPSGDALCGQMDPLLTCFTPEGRLCP